MSGLRSLGDASRRINLALRRAKGMSILQQLNMALAIGVIVVVGDAVQNILIEEPRIVGLAAFERLFLLAFMLLWAAKVFVDDHYIMETASSKSAPWVDFLLCIASYSFLISAAALLKEPGYSDIGLFLHFSILMVWILVGMFPRRERPDENREKKTYWLLADLGCWSVLLLLILLAPSEQVRIAATCLLFLFGILDVRCSETFSSDRLR